jgi:hypothetical protein
VEEAGEGAVAALGRGHVGHVRPVSRTRLRARAEAAPGNTGTVPALELGHRVAATQGRALICQVIAQRTAITGITLAVKAEFPTLDWAAEPGGISTGTTHRDGLILPTGTAPLPITLPLGGQTYVLTSEGGAVEEAGEGAVAALGRGHVGHIRPVGRTQLTAGAEPAPGDTGPVFALEIGHRVTGGSGGQGHRLTAVRLIGPVRTMSLSITDPVSLNTPTAVPAESQTLGGAVAT